jgi:HK97 family phage prohead protease
MITKTFNIKEVSEVGDSVYCEGWANKAIADRVGDVIPSDAWNLENYKKVPIVLYNHERDKPVGRAVSIEAKPDGLWIKAKLSSSMDPEISKVRSLVKEGILNAFSVGIEEVESYRENEFNIFKRCELLEVSIVTVPMNQDSTFSYSNKSSGTMLLKKVKDKSMEIDTEKYHVLAYQIVAVDEAMALEAALPLGIDALEMVEEGVYLAILDDSMDRLEAQQIDLGNGVVAYVMEREAMEAKAALDGDVNKIDENPHLEQARQTNVMLAVLIEEVKKIAMMISESMPKVEVEVEPMSELEEIKLAMGKLAETMQKLGA